MSNESEILRAGPANAIHYNNRRQHQRLAEQQPDMDSSSFRQEQALKKEKIGDATALVVMKAEELAKSGTPMSKKQLADACIASLAQANFEMVGDDGRMQPRDGEGSAFSLPEYGYFMDIVEMATQGVPIAAKAGIVTTDGVKPMTAERFRNIFEGALKKLRHTVSMDPELKATLPQFFKESSQPTLGFHKLDKFSNLSDYISRFSN